VTGAWGRSALAGAVLLGAAALARPAAAPNPLAGVVLEDDAGRSWRLGELVGTPVLLVVADRTASADANEWGRRLAAAGAPLAPWRAAGTATWLAVADLRRVPEYAREAARARVREREAGRSPGERQRSSPLLLDWDGRIAGPLGAERGRALVVLIGADGRILIQARGAPTDATVAGLRETVAGAIAR
jgi:hypothetical protein